MAKKRQMDFQRTHLKVGRPAGRRKNITSTAFKAKKIIVHNKQPKPKSGRSIADILSKIKSSNISTTIKGNYLKELLTLIQDQSETLLRNLCEILDYVLTLTVDTDEKVKKLCVDILMVVFEATEDIHLHNYVDRITRTIICLLKGSSNHSKLLSLSLLDSMLKHHSNVIVHCMPLLNNLVNQVSFSKRKHHSYTNSLLGASSVGVKNIYSTRFQINIIGHINTFLKELLKKMTEEEEEPEVLEGYFDGKGPVSWTNVPAGGCRRRWYNPDKSYLKRLDLQNPYFDDSGEIEEFIHDFFNCVPLVYIEETASVVDSDDNVLQRETIKNLSILFEAFSKVGEWAKLISFTRSNTEIRRFLSERIFNGKRFPFYTTSPIGGGTTQFLPCVQLNLALCHLCVEYLVRPGEANDIYNEEVFNYLKMVLGKSDKLMPYDIKYESIPMILKIIKVYLGMTDDPDVSEFLNTCLEHLCSLVKVNDDRDNQKQLVSFLMKMSVDPAYYSFVAESDGMKIFFNWLLRELREKNGRLERKYFKTIKKIANLKYPVFFQALSKLNFVALKGLLKNNNEDVRDTAIIIIYHMEEISDSLLESLTRFILLEPRFPKADAIRLIRLLKCRFFDIPTDDKSKASSVYSSTGFVNFTLFLINLAIDICSMDNDKMNDFDSCEFANSLKPVRNNYPYDVIPSLYWEEHEELFDVCLKCLKQLPIEPVTELLMTVICDVLDAPSVPIHCAIAMMKLDDDRFMTAKPYRLKMYDLTFSCLMTLSILTQLQLDDDWYQWNVNALQDSMDLTREKALQIVEFVQNKRYAGDEEYDSFVVYNFLRIFQFFLTEGLLDREDGDRMLNLLDFFKETCEDRSIAQQPLFIEALEYYSSFE